MIGADGAKGHAGHGNATEASILVRLHCTLSINVPESFYLDRLSKKKYNVKYETTSAL
jgi:hypothetical protein